MGEVKYEYLGWMPGKSLCSFNDPGRRTVRGFAKTCSEENGFSSRKFVVIFSSRKIYQSRAVWRLGNLGSGMYKKIKIEDAIGLKLAHDITQIIPGGFKGAAFRRGQVIRKSDIPKFLDLGKKQELFFLAGDIVMRATRLSRHNSLDYSFLTKRLQAILNVRSYCRSDKGFGNLLRCYQNKGRGLIDFWCKIGV